VFCTAGVAAVVTSAGLLGIAGEGFSAQVGLASISATAATTAIFIHPPEKGWVQDPGRTVKQGRKPEKTKN
jgi:hypothetical protein